VPARQWLPAFQESGTFSVFIPVSSVSRQKSFFCRMASEDRCLWLPGKRFSVFTGVGELARRGFSAPGQVPPAPVTDVSPEAGRERGDSIKNAGGDAPA